MNLLPDVLAQLDCVSIALVVSRRLLSTVVVQKCVFAGKRQATQ